MLKKYKNEIHQIISEFKINPNDFEYTEVILNNNILRSNFTYKDSKMALTVDESPSSHHRLKVLYSKFEKNFPQVSTSSDWTNFEIASKHIRNWLKNELLEYILELDDIDFWDRTITQSNLFRFALIDLESNDIFIEDEKDKITQGLNQAKVQIKEKVDLSTAQLQIINERFDYMILSLKRIENKRDWKGVALSSIISMVITMGVDVDTGKAIWEIFKNVFSNITSLPS